jgi:hypothetical protein
LEPNPEGLCLRWIARRASFTAADFSALRAARNPEYMAHV